MSTRTCPICGASATERDPTGDADVIQCPACGCYKLAGTALAGLEMGSLGPIDPARFRAIVAQKRTASTDCPVVTSGDLGG